MKKIHLLLLTIIVSLVWVACKKQAWQKVDAVEKEMAGLYNVTNYKVTLMDSMGNIINSEDHKNFGTIEMTMNTDEGSDVFSHIIFKGPVFNSFVPLILRSGAYYCGELDQPNEKFSCFYQGDPYDKRILLAAICASITNSYFMTYQKNGRNLLFFTRVPDASGNQTLYEYYLERQ